MVYARSSRWRRCAVNFRSDAHGPDGWTRADHSRVIEALRFARVAVEGQSKGNVNLHERGCEMRSERRIHDCDRSPSALILKRNNKRSDLRYQSQNNWNLGSLLFF